MKRSRTAILLTLTILAVLALGGWRGLLASQAGQALSGVITLRPESPFVATPMALIPSNQGAGAGDRSTQTFVCNALNVGRFALEVDIQAFGDTGDLVGAKITTVQPNTGDSLTVNSSIHHSRYWCRFNYAGPQSNVRGNMEIYNDNGLFFFIDAR